MRTELPKSPVDGFLHVDEELLDQRAVEAEFLADTLVDMRRCAIAHDGDHGIDRHDTADEEGDGDEAEEGRRQHDDELGDFLKEGAEGTGVPSAPVHDC